MAFDALGWSPDSRPTGLRIHSYSSNDSKATVLGANYFSDVWGQVRVDDKIECVEADTNTAFTVYITAVSRDSVTTSEAGLIEEIVVPAGDTFKFVDDSASPTYTVSIVNQDTALNDGRMGFKVNWSTGDTSSDLEFAQVVDTQKGNFGTGYFQAQLTNANGQKSIYFAQAADGTASITYNGEAFILSGLSTYADNAAAVAGGLTAGYVYQTAGGELRIVV